MLAAVRLRKAAVLHRLPYWPRNAISSRSNNVRSEFRLSTIPAYEYPPVPLPSAELGEYIRVLDILPGRPDDPLRLALRASPLDVITNKYEALSYPWGASTKGRSVTVNETHQIPVTDNLFNALRRLRRRYRRRTMWIDALTISQLDVKERSNQVAIINKIFARASHVNIWLGEPEPKSAFTISWSSLRLALKTAWLGEHLPLFRRVSVAVAIARNQHLALASAVEQSRLRWHERAWVIQEFILARRLRLMFGSHAWTRGDRTLNAVVQFSHLSNLEYHRGIVQRLWSRLESRANYRQNADLVRVAPHTGNASATDARDLVYSILGLIGAEEAKLIGADYTLPFVKVCAKATWASMRARNDHAILQWIRAPEDPSRSGLPSWAVNFDSHEARGMADLQADRTAYPSEHVSLGAFRPSKENACPPVVLNAELDRLTFSGVNCGQVMQVFEFGADLDSRDLPLLIHEAVVQNLDFNASPASKALLRRALQVPLRTPLSKTHGVYSWHALAACDSLSAGRDWSLSSQSEKIIVSLLRAWDSLAQALHRRDPHAVHRVKEFVLSADHPVRISNPSSLPNGLMRAYPPLFVLDNGILGIGPSWIAQGDFIVAKPGNDESTSPFLVLRKCDDGSYTYRGLAYVHGCMHAAFWQDWQELEPMGETFVLS